MSPLDSQPARIICSLRYTAPFSQLTNSAIATTVVHSTYCTSLPIHQRNPSNSPFFIINTAKMRSKFKDEHPFEKRKAEADRIRTKYNDRIPVCPIPTTPSLSPSCSQLPSSPAVLKTLGTRCHPISSRKQLADFLQQVICEKIEKSDIATIDKKKYLVPADLTVGQFVYVIRKRIKLAPEKAIFIFVDEVLPPTAALMSAIYEEHKCVTLYLLSGPMADLAPLLC